MRIGYARVSTTDQDNNLQVDALKRANCDLILEEKASGGSLSRPILLGLLDKLQQGDTVVIYKVDRIARSIRGLLAIAERIDEAGAELQSLTEALDTTTAVGRMIFNIIGAFAEFEREVIRERTIAGLAAAKSRGRIGGRRSIIELQASEILALWQTGKHTKSELARKFQTHISSIKRLLKRHKAEALPSNQMLLNV
jgi:DNA invertase Pin-like site-specific DNA recombinase